MCLQMMRLGFRLLIIEDVHKRVFIVTLWPLHLSQGLNDDALALRLSSLLILNNKGLKSSFSLFKLSLVFVGPDFRSTVSGDQTERKYP